MDVITISDPCDQSFPFSKELFDDPQVIYHGTCSAYSGRIESEGFGGFELPFKHEDVAIIARAWERVGIYDSYVDTVFSPGVFEPRKELSMTGGFFHARAYSTDAGGEVVRVMLKEAREFEALCLHDEKRLALKNRWENGLRKTPGDVPTLRAVRVLEDKQALQEICNEVTLARKAIEGVTAGGFPVVYALLVEPEWFPETWERYICHWEEGSRGAVELRCGRELLSNDRILAKVVYPNGTDPISQWDGSRRGRRCMTSFGSERKHP